MGKVRLSGAWLERINGQTGFCELENISSGDTLIVNSVRHAYVCKGINHLISAPDVKRFVHYYDPLERLFAGMDVKNSIESIKATGFIPSTFDKQDAEKYGLFYAGQYYRFPESTKECNLEYDFVFAGLRKDRGEKIDSFKQTADKLGFKSFIHAVKVHKDGIPYEAYLDHMKRSRCILDFTQGGQRGLTLRPLEAMFFDKKLVTDNADIKNYPFYYPENIFVYGLDDIHNLPDFMNRPYHRISNDIKNMYDVNTWLKNFACYKTSPSGPSDI